jgi:hypothetical protein
MVIGLATGVLCAVATAAYSRGDRAKGLTTLLTFGSLLCATHILGVVPFVASAVMFTVITVGKRRHLTRGEWVGVAFCAAWVVLVGVYYLWTLTRGVETGGKTPFTFGIGSLVFSGYELLGFVGFGPGRFELRQMALEGGVGDIVGAMIRPAMIGGITLLGLYCHLFLKILMRSKRESPENVPEQQLSLD